MHEHARAAAAHLRAVAQEALPDLAPGPVDVRLLRTTVRGSSSLDRVSLIHHFVVSSPATVHRVIVKGVAPGRDADATPPARPERPRLVSIADPLEKPGLEFAALRAVEANLARLRDPRFLAVRAIASFPDINAFAMLEIPARPLSRVVAERSRLTWPRNPSGDLDAAVRGAGAWLRAYHRMPPPADAGTRQADRGAVAEAFDALAGYVAAGTGRRDVLRLRAIGRELAEALPEPLPIGLSHGDFALRNILVDDLDRVAVIDLLARFRAPISEDLAQLLISVPLSRVQSLSRGRALGSGLEARIEAAAVAGYFGGDPVPWTEIRTYQLLLLLDRWSARIERSGRSSAGRTTGPIDRLMDAHFGRVAARWAEDATRA